jgi:hypothetical protein
MALTVAVNTTSGTGNYTTRRDATLPRIGSRIAKN